jgi:hypothetical protein
MRVYVLGEVWGKAVGQVRALTSTAVALTDVERQLTTRFCLPHLNTGIDAVAGQPEASGPGTQGGLQEGRCQAWWEQPACTEEQQRWAGQVH